MPPLILWLCIAAAVLLFWAVGAYNRLMRLRSGVSKAFAALDEQLVRQIVWVQGCLPEPMRNLTQASPIELQDKVTATWVKLSAASDQFAAALAGARSDAIANAPVMASLVLAHEAMCTALADALAAAVAPDAVPQLQAQWTGLLHQTWSPRAAFDEAVRTYNQARTQFPASIIARLSGFKPAGTATRIAEFTHAAR
ncbi:MAG: LemA family protein [Burkholderiaceae bacterium]|jgi:LemA protein|nr:LemA family protein [Burkholderiaceae bacterium]